MTALIYPSASTGWVGVKPFFFCPRSVRFPHDEKCGHCRSGWQSHSQPLPSTGLDLAIDQSHTSTGKPKFTKRFSRTCSRISYRRPSRQLRQATQQATLSSTLGKHKHSAGRLVLLSPTWRGPLPTMAGGSRPVFSKIARAFDLPVFGAMLYRLNVNKFVIGMMARGHVYADPAWLKGHRFDEKLGVTRAPGARHASARFVTGCLDPFAAREEQLDTVRRIADPILVAFSDNAPPKSRAEMEALAEMANVEAIRLPSGKLSFYEEFPTQTADAVHEFLTSVVSN